MNRYLCDPNTLVLANLTAYHFSNKISDISVFLLPILALFGNGLTILVVFMNPELNGSSFSVYVKSLAVSDTLVLVFKLISYINKTFKNFYFASLCTVLVFFSESSVLLSVWTIMIITIERSLVVLYPLHKTKLVSRYRARIIIGIIAATSILFSSRVLFVPMEPSINNTFRCRPKGDWFNYTQINSTITDFAYCYIPLIIVVVGNCLTICTVKEAISKRQNLLANNSSKHIQHNDSSEHQLMLMLFVVTFMFIIYFVPFTILKAVARLGLPFNYCFTSESFGIYIFMRSLFEFLKDCNFCTNFIIYCISGRRFRHGFINVLKYDARRSSAASKNFQVKRNGSDYLLKQTMEQKSNNASRRITIDESQL